MESSSSSTTLNYFSNSPNLNHHLQTPSPRSSRQAHFPAARRSSQMMICRSAAAVRTTFPETTRTATLYDVLRVQPSVSSREIKAAYRGLAKMYHPDTMMMIMAAGEDSDGCRSGDFIEIRNAYETLSDPSTRAMYDLSMRLGASARRRSYSSVSSGYSSATRRWETDQCW